MKLSRGLLVPAVAALLLASGGAAPAAAATRDCRSLVSDPQKYLKDRAAVTEAARRVQDAGGDVYVTVVKSVPDRDVDRYQLQLEKSCPSWRAASGTTGAGRRGNKRKNNLVSLVLAVGDRTTGLYYGSEFTDELDGVWLDIQTEEVNPAFKRKAYDEGLVAGLDAVARELHGEGSGFGDDEVSPPFESYDVPGNELPFTRTGNGLPAWMPVAAGGVALTLLVFFLGRWLLKRRRRRAMLDALRAEAIQARHQAQDAFLSLEQEDDALEAAVAAYTTGAGTPDEELLAQATATRTTMAEAQQRYLTAADAAASAPVSLDKPARASADESDYTRPRHTFAAIRHDIDTVAAAARDTTARVTAAHQLILDLPQDTRTCRSEIEAVTAARSTARADSMTTGRADEVLEPAVAELSAVENLRLTGELARASTDLQALRNRLTDAAGWLAGLAARRAEAGTSLADLDTAAAALRTDLNGAEEHAGALTGMVAVASLRGVREAGMAAETALASLTTTLEAVRSGLTGVVDVDAVTARVQEAVGFRDAALSHASAAREGLAAVESARQMTPGELAAAAEELAAAGRTLTHPTDVPHLVVRMDAAALGARLAVAQGRHDKAAASWAEVPPDVLAAADGARAARVEAAAVRTTVEQAVAAAVALLQQATAALESAHRAVQSATYRVQAGGYDVGAAAHAELGEASARLGSAQAALRTEPETTLPLAQHAERLAWSAAARADADVREAEERRERRRRRQMAAMMAASRRSSSSSFSSSSSGLSGGGSSGGGGGGGGSSRW